jgi:hypothetical protein
MSARMRGIVRNSCFVVSLLAPLIVGGACVATWSHAYVRMEQNEKLAKLLISYRGQMRFISYQVFSDTWKIWKVTPTADSISVSLDSDPRPIKMSGQAPSSIGAYQLSGGSLSFNPGSDLTFAKG